MFTLPVAVRLRHTQCAGGRVCVQMRLRVSVQYRSIASDPTYGAGLAKGGGIGAVPNTYFPMREGCRLVLYQDAHQARLHPSPAAIRKTAQPAELFISMV